MEKNLLDEAQGLFNKFSNLPLPLSGKTLYLTPDEQSEYVNFLIKFEEKMKNVPDRPKIQKTDPATSRV